LLTALAVSIACAGARPRVLLVRSTGAEPQLAHRLQAEFTNLGIDVIEAPDEAGPDPAAMLTEAAKREQAFAAVRVVSDVGGVTVWVADRLTNKTLVRTLTARTGPIGGEVVALEVVELLRASLLELKVVEPSQAAPPSEVSSLLGPDDRGEKLTCWPAPEYPETTNRKQLGNLRLSSKEEDLIVAFLKTLTDGYAPSTK